jgi:prevent-host-death family protein
MTEVYPLTNARSRLGELVNRARFGRERVILTEHGTPVAALISVDELAELQATADEADIAVAARVKAAGHSGIPHEEVMAAFDALDAADHADSSEQAKAILAPYSSLLDQVRHGMGGDEER